MNPVEHALQLSADRYTDQITIFRPQGRFFGQSETPVQAHKIILPAGVPDTPYESDPAVGTFRTVPINGTADIHEVLKAQEGRANEYIVRGEPIDPDGTPSVRRAYLPPNAGITDVPRFWACFDIDNLTCPQGIDPTSEEVVHYALSFFGDTLKDTQIAYQFSNSAGTPDKSHLIKLHVYFCTMEKMPTEKWGHWVDTINVQAGFQLVDPSLFRAHQPHYTASPEFQGCDDPFAGRARTGFLDGPMPRVMAPDLTGARRVQRTGSRGGGGGDQSIVYGGDGRATDGREKLLRNIRYDIAQTTALRDLDHAHELVWARFQAEANLEGGKWTEADVRQRVEGDRAILDTINRPRVEPEEAPELPGPLASTQLQTALGTAVRNGDRALIKAAAGLGKSSGVAKFLTKYRSGEYVEIYLDTHNETGEWEHLLRKKGFGRVRVIKGRSPGNCEYFETVEAAQQNGFPVEANVCKSCPLYNAGCAYYQQDKDDKPAARLYVTNHLLTKRRKELPMPSIVVVDEAFDQKMITNEFTLARKHLEVFQPDRGKRKKAEIAEFSSNHLDVLMRMDNFRDLCGFLRKAATRIADGEVWYGDATSQQIAGHAFTLKRFREAKVLRCDDDLSFEQRRDRFLSAQVKVHNHIEMALTFAAQDLERFGEVRRVHQGKGENEDVFLRITARHDMKRLENYEGGLILLDADGEPEIVRKLVGDLDKFVSISAERNAKIIQLTDHSNTRTALYKRKEATAKGTESVQFARAVGGVLITYKGLRNAETEAEDKEREFTDDSGLRWGYFGNVRGYDGFKDANTLTILGRHDIGTDPIIDRARSLFWDDDTPIDTHWEKVFVNDLPGRQYRDHRCQAVHRATVEAETRQAVDRLRLIHREEPATIYLLSNQPVPGLKVDHYATWKDLTTSMKINELFDLFGGVVPLNEKVLAKHGAFATESAARSCIEGIGQKSLYDLYRVSWPILEGTYRVRGQRGRNPSRVLVRSDVLDPKEALEVTVGPLAHYDGPSALPSFYMEHYERFARVGFTFVQDDFGWDVEANNDNTIPEPLIEHFFRRYNAMK